MQRKTVLRTQFSAHSCLAASIREAKAKAEKIVNDANAKADALVKDAKGRSETLVKSYEKQIAAKRKSWRT